MTAPRDILYLSETALEALDIAPAAVADAIETALRAKAAGTLHSTPKSAILPGDDRYMMSTLAVGTGAWTVVKQVTVCPDNPGLGLPAINGAIMVLDARTGLLRAVLDANWVTAIRTAGLSEVAARRLADPGSQTIAFVGTGVQAHAHLAAFAPLFPLRRVQVLGRGLRNAERLCEAARALGLEARLAEGPEDALRDADIVVTSVTLDYSIEPFLDARLLKPTAFAAITDLCIPWLPQAMETFGTVIVDDLVQETESARPMLPADQIAGDLTGLVAGDVPERRAGQPAAFAFRGIALGDYAAAVLAVETALARDLGQRIPA